MYLETRGGTFSAYTGRQILKRQVDKERRGRRAGGRGECDKRAVNDRGRGLKEMHRITRERGSGSGVRDLFLCLSLSLSLSLEIAVSRPCRCIGF